VPSAADMDYSRKDKVGYIRQGQTVKDKNYHHGDLRKSLIDSARMMIRDGGVEAVSLRKLADRVGVSRTAAYHYFKDKNVLLCTLAEEGFRIWQTNAHEIFNNDALSPADRYRAYIHWYMTYAVENAEYYDLMFGRAIWKNQEATESLKKISYEVFHDQVDVTRKWQKLGVLPEKQDSLRLAQVSWGLLHGLARLLIDGIYSDSSPINEMCDCAADLLMEQHV